MLGRDYATGKSIEIAATAAGALITSGGGGGGGGGGGDASAANQLAGNATLIDILTELRDDIAFSESIWRSRVSGAFFVRRTTVNQDTGAIAIAWQNPDGTAATPIIADLDLAIANKDFEVAQTVWIAKAAGTGYSVGDTVLLIVLLDTAIATAATAIWFNGTTRLVLSTPPVAGNLDPIVGIRRGLGATASGTITAGGTAQIAIAANPNRNYLLIQNNSSADLWINYSAAATIGLGLKLAVGGSYENPSHFCPIGAVSIIGATTAQQFTVVEA